MRTMYAAIAGGILSVVLVVAIAPKAVTDTPQTKDSKIVSKMNTCLNESLPNSVGEEQIGHTFRICWMRAQKG